MGLWTKFRNIAARQGPKAALSAGFGYVYNRTVWPFLPETDEWVQFNGVDVRRRRLGDAYMPIPTLGSDLHIDYETILGDAIRDNVSPGDSVIEVAGGIGVTATIAARQVGTAGEVLTIEGSTEQAREARATVERNGVDDRVTVRNTIVGTSTASVRASTHDDVPMTTVAELPSSDVLIIDCDGCEYELLEALETVAPKRVIVEHHAVLNVDPSIPYEPKRIQSMIEAREYSIIDTYRQPMEAKNPEFGDEETVFVAVRSGDSN